MSNYGKFAFRGYYNGQFLRSYNEFLYAVNLEFIEKKQFIVEPFSLHSTITDKRKIPDFLVFTDETDYHLVEIKGNENSNIDTIVDYATNQYELGGLSVKFVNINQKNMKSKIIGNIGIVKFSAMDKEYKQQRDMKFYTGFSGEKNPMFGRRGDNNPNFGKKKTEEQRAKSSGKNNGMFNRTHSLAAREKIGLKWQDAKKSKSMLLAGLTTCILKLTVEQQENYLSYVTSSLDNKIKKPAFVNNYISVSDNKIKKYFNDSKIDFLEFVERIVCQK
jgi:hypothetical protein